jgi:hypothetical protein
MIIDRRVLIAGAGAVGSLAAGSAALSQSVSAPSGPVIRSRGDATPMSVRWAFSISIFFKERIGITSSAHRAFVPVVGGEIWGPRLTGRVAPYGGADYAGANGLDAHYTLEANDGALIYIHNRGYMTPVRNPGDPPPPPRAAPPPRKPGEPIDQTFVAPADSERPLRMRLTPFFDAPDGPHAWMTRSLFVGHGQRYQGPDHTIFTYYEVL